MCSIEEAWGSNNTFQEKKVFTHSDVRNQYMNTPENLNYPSMSYGPMTKNLPPLKIILQEAFIQN